jgi:glycine/D-amino acid oxidase-like deaminating enzyme
MSHSTRIVVVGAGIVGASVAYHLARRGVAVVVIEGAAAGSATGAGAGIICPWTNPDGNPAYRLGADGARYYPELISMLAEDGQAGTGYQRVGALCLTGETAAHSGTGAWAGGAAADRTFLRETEAHLRSQVPDRPEIGEISVLPPGGPRELFPPLADGLSAVWIGGASRIDGRAIRGSLLRAAARHGARRVTGTAVLTERRGRVTGAVEVTSSEVIEADTVVVAAGAWTAQICAELSPAAVRRLAIGPQRGQIVHLDMPGTDTGRWPVVLPADGPYLLAFPPSRVVLGATREDAGFDDRVTAGGLGGLLAAAAVLAPGLADATVAETRVGFRPVTPDGLPLLGALTDGLVIAAGNGPEGLTAGPWTGRAAAALALGERPPADLTAFDPARPLRRPAEPGD